ncbi:glycosyltransferase [Haloimpatiens sp. FM7330]|uniref:CgeB family protein n=1 Tax=Haloimpatiens sp. FM7330 TaxID=3298610 RepID=UPI00362A489D
MRILFLESHPMWIYGLPRGFQDIGHKVLISSISTKRNLYNKILKYKPDLVFSMGWTKEHSKEKQSWLKKYLKKAKIPHIYWATEDPTHTKTFTLPLIRNSKIDFIFTICPSMVDFYKKMGINSAHLDFAYQPGTHYKTKSELKYAKPIAVVANAYPHILKKYTNHYRIQSIKTLIKPLIKKNIRVDFWGKDWDKMRNILRYKIPNRWIHGYLDYIKANKVYSSSDIILGLQNHETQLTQRTYEILGSQGFLITSDTKEIRRLFKPGYDLVVSSCAEETVELVKYYSKKPDEREKIRIKGNKTVEENHTYKHRALYIMDVLKKEGIIRSTI